MKNKNKIILLSLLTITPLLKPNAATMALVSFQAEKNLIMQMSEAEQKSLMQMSEAEQKLHLCVKKIAPKFNSLSVWNYKSKSSIDLLETSRVEILKTIASIEHTDLSPAIKQIKELLHEMGNSSDPVPSFKKVLTLIPAATKQVVAGAIQDKIIKFKLGL